MLSLKSFVVSLLGSLRKLIGTPLDGPISLLESCLVPILTAFRYLFPSTDKAYEQFAKEKGFQPESVPLPHGGQGHWLGRKDAKYVLIFFHGMRFSYTCSTSASLSSLLTTSLSI
jgi:hypothetical protein